MGVITIAAVHGTCDASVDARRRYLSLRSETSETEENLHALFWTETEVHALG